MYFQNRYEYLFAPKEYDDYKKSNPDATNDELVALGLPKGKAVTAKLRKDDFYFH